MKEKLHILHVPKWYPNPEDPQLGIFIQKQIKAASKYDKQSVLYIKSLQGIDTKYTIEVKEHDAITEVYIFYKKPESRAKQFFLLTKLYEKGFEKINELQGKLDILHVHNLISPAVWSYKYARDNEIPWVLSEHWSGYTKQTGYFASKMMWERKLWQWYSEKAQCTIAVSEFLKSTLVKSGIGLKHQIIPNIVEAIYEKSERDDSEIRILNVSDMVDDIKNISGVLFAFSKLIVNYPNLRLYLVGAGKDLAKLKSKAEKLGISSKVTFFGRLKNEDVLKMYNQIDFVLINSRVETFSVVAAESLLAGKPVITTKCGGVEEFITQEQGILIEVDETRLLEEGLEKMILNYKKYNSNNLQSYAKEKFSSEVIGSSLHDIYHSIIT